MTNDLVTWLRAQLDDDERLARKALDIAPAAWVSTYRDVHAIDPESGATHHVLTAESGALAWHAARYDPARALAEVDAKRRIVDRHSRIEVFGTVFCSYCCTLQGQRPGNGYWPCPEILDAAAPYADRPGYRDEWRP